MRTADQPLETLADIRRMMERSSRFISLSGWSGVSAGLCALAGAWMAVQRISLHHVRETYACQSCIVNDLALIAAIVFVGAFGSAFFFTYLRSRQTGVQIWGASALRLLWNTVVPMIAGGIVIVKLLLLGYYALIAPCCLIFYGLALINGSKYTLGEVRYLGYGQVLLGLVNLWIPGYSLIFWAAGFGILHIVYGIMMWRKYERN